MSLVVAKKSCIRNVNSYYNICDKSYLLGNHEVSEMKQDVKIIGLHFLSIARPAETGRFKAE